MEMRFFIPSNELAGDVDPVEAFQKQVMKKASVISVSGDAIAIFREIQCLTPRFVDSIFVHLAELNFEF
jgi:structure-specific recognition protein 1